MSTDRLIPGWVNPLAFLEVDEAWASITKATPTIESVLRFLCPADEPLDLEKIVARYRQISTEPVRLLLAPAGGPAGDQRRFGPRRPSGRSPPRASPGAWRGRRGPAGSGSGTAGTGQNPRRAASRGRDTVSRSQDRSSPGASPLRLHPPPRRWCVRKPHVNPFHRVLCS